MEKRIIYKWTETDPVTGADTTPSMPKPVDVAAAIAALATSPVKAWVNFNGTGTVAIRASFNVSSITDNGTGDYTINFTTALEDANYALAGSSRRVDSYDQVAVLGEGRAALATRSTTQVRVLSNDPPGS